MASTTLEQFELYNQAGSPNSFKVAIILEELGLPWVLKAVPGGHVKSAEFVELNPNGRTPALVDPNQNMTLWESGAIIDYLISEYDPSGKLQYLQGPEKHLTRCWEHFQMSVQGPYFGQSGWFHHLHHEKLPSAIERYIKEVRRVTGVLDTHLAKQKTDYLVGDRVTFADLMFVPYYQFITSFDPEFNSSKYPAFKVWNERLNARPAVVKVYDIMMEERAKQGKAAS